MSAIDRAGVWCKDEDGRLGISATDNVYEKNGQQAFNEDGSPRKEQTFHVVDARGDTAMMVYRPWAGLVRAKAADLPKERVSHLAPQDLADMGYETYDAEGNLLQSRAVRQSRPKLVVVSQFIPAKQ